MSGAILSEGAVCLLSGAGGAAKSTLATTLALDVASGCSRAYVRVDRRRGGDMVTKLG